MQKLIVIMIVALGIGCQGVIAQEPINVEKLATAIKLAEGNPNYGILKNIKGHNFRKACIQTIQKRLARWNGRGDFISYLGSSYCPIGASNDSKGLNINWIKNVKYYYYENN